MNKQYQLSISFLCLFMFPLFLFAQTYKAKIYGANNLKVKGILYAVTDSSIVLANYSKIGEQSFDTISFSKIKKIYLLKKGSGGIGFAIGASASIATGIILAAGETDEESKNTYKMIDIGFGIALSPLVGAIGLVIGKNSGKNFIINYDYTQFQSEKNQIAERAYIK